MLSASYLSKLPAPFVEIFSELEISILKDMARRLSKANYKTDTYKWQNEKLLQLGYLQKEIDEAIRKTLKTANVEVTEMMEYALQKSVATDNVVARQAYEQGSLLTYPLDLKDSEKLVLLLQAGIKQTQYEIRNFTRTMAITAINQFHSSLDLAYMQVATGAITRREATRIAVQTLARNGIKIVSYASGRTDQVDVAARRAILTGLNKTDSAITETHIQEIGAKLVYTSAHIGARPEHEVWQGKVFYWDIPVQGYESFREVTGYGTVTGIMGANCRHRYGSFFEGLSKEPERYDKDKSNKMYEQEQKQRYLERTIRKWKREAETLEAGGVDSKVAKDKVKQGQAEMRKFIEETGLTRQGWREQI